MAQSSTYTVPAAVSGNVFRTTVNTVLGDIITTNSGATAPVGIEVRIGMLWYNTAATTISGIPSGTVGVCTAVTNQGTETGAGTWTPVGTEGAITEAHFTTVFGSSTKDLGDISSVYTAATDALALSIDDNTVDVDELNATVDATPANDAGKLLSLDSAGTGLEWTEVDTTIADLSIAAGKLINNTLTTTQMATNIKSSGQLNIPTFVLSGSTLTITTT